MEVRAGRTAGGADVADDLALLDPLAAPHAAGEPAHVAVGG